MATALIVDDEMLVGRSLARILEKRGWRALIATTERQALEQIGSEAIDILLIDVFLEKKSGIDLAQSLMMFARVLWDRRCDLVFMSGLQSEELVAMGFNVNLGACFFLDKPFDLEAVDAMLSIVTTRARSHQQQDDAVNSGAPQAAEAFPPDRRPP